MAICVILDFILLASYCCEALKIKPTISMGNDPYGQCPSQEQYQKITNKVIQDSMDLVRGMFLSSSCSVNDGSWNRVAYLNMSDTSHSCPDSWSTFNFPARGCGRNFTTINSTHTEASCDSVFYSTNHTFYSQVCGRINGYQYGNPNAFNSSINASIGLDSWYIDGVSLTYGVPGAREHVWSFVNAWYDVMPSYTEFACPCMYSNKSEWPHYVPEFVGNNYFCDTGSRNEVYSAGLMTEDLLWDGAGCGGHGSTCCQDNSPPWFTRRLEVATSDDLEVRICGDQWTDNENTVITSVELFVR